MRTLTCRGAVLALVAVLAAACSSAPPTGSDIGKSAADFALTGADGKRHRLSDYRGKVVILDFWATWCGPCTLEVPGFVALQSKYGDRLVVLGASIDEGWDPIRPFMTRYNVNYPVVLVDDRSLLTTYRVDTGIPTTFVIDQSGVIRMRHVGYAPQDVFEKAIQTALATET